MPDDAVDIILHNYPQSPVAEKVRVAFGIKGISWYSVEIPRLAPKPMLTRLTGGYRRTPVMQIGADIYCDSQCIIRELERRQPAPGFFPSAETGLIWCLSRWTDGAFFDASVRFVLGAAGSALPEDFAADRGRLYFGPDWAARLKDANAALPHLAAQLRTPLKWIDQTLSDARAFLLGDTPAAIDAQVYHVVWFIRGRWESSAEFLSEFPHLERWEKAVAALGHGRVSDMTPDEAIARAAAHAPETLSGNIDDRDPQGLRPGMNVTVSPDLDGGEQPVEGTLVAADCETVSIARSDADVGSLHVHFPRAGYRVDIIG